jgi:hypothetical protein
MKLEEKNAYHIEVLNHELGQLQVSVESIKTDVSWLKEMFSKSLWAIGVPLVLILIGVGVQLMK